MEWKSRSAEERRNHIGSFIAVTPTMKRATDVLRRCYRAYHEEPQASCSFIVGETGVGKTTVANDFLEEIRGEYLGTIMDEQNLKLADDADYDHTMSVTFEKPGHGFVRPVVKIQVSKKTTYKQLFSDTLAAIGLTVRRATLGEMMSIARQQIKEQGIRLIIFDDCQHIAESGLTRDPYEAADVFKALMKEARVQIACVGLPHAADFLLESAQLETLKNEELRMMPFPLDLSEHGEYRAFLKAFSDDLPFDRKPSLESPQMALRLHLASDGYVAAIAKYIGLAAKEAIDRDMETITTDLVGEVYRRKHNVPDNENPFLKAEVEPDGFREIKATRRQERLLEARKGRATRRAKTRKPSLRKGAARQ